MSTRDIRYAARSIRGHPGFAAMVIVTLALGLAAAIAAFSVMDSVLFRQLPFPAAKQLLWVGEDDARWAEPDGPSMPVFRVWRERAHTLSGLAVYHVQPHALSDIDTPTRIAVGEVSAPFFATLGVRPHLGRGFVESDDRPGATPVTVLGDSLWRSAFHADPAIIGRTVMLDGAPATVVGVMPPDFSVARIHVAAWTPIVPALGFLLNDTRMHVDGAIARLRPGATVESATSELRALARQLPPGVQRPADSTREVAPHLVSLRSFAAGNVAPVLLLVLGASVLVLLITCVNAANLMLARGVARRREVAIRRALGASQWSIVRQLLVESALLAAASGALGTLLALAMARVIATQGVRQLPRATEISVHGGAVLFALGLVAVATLLFGLAPALHVARGGTAEALKNAAASVSENHASARWREVLAVVELAVALVLLAGAGVLGRSVALTLGGHRGIESDHVLVASIMRPFGAWPADRGPMRQFGQQLVARLEAEPGVRAAAISLEVPGNPQATEQVRGVGTNGSRGDSLDAKAEVVTADYFRAVGIRLLRGRLFDARLDRPEAPSVLIISRSLAQRFFPRSDPVGQYLMAPGDDSKGPVPPVAYQIVGVVEDIRSQGPDPRPIPEFYVFFAHEPVPHMTVIVRSDATPAVMSTALRKVVASLDPGQPVTDLHPLDTVLARSAARPKFFLMILGAFAVTAVLLSVIGLFGVMIMLVRQRLREIAVRMALGANGAQVMRLVLGRGALLVLLGLSFGMGGAWAATRALTSLLSGVSPTDPVALTAAAVGLGVVALLASYLPARAASLVDPVVVLRME